MRISYKNTALGFLDDPKNFPMHTPADYSKPTTDYENLKLMNGLVDQFSEPGFSKHFSNNIQYITQPFYEAYKKSERKLKEVVLATELDDSGTFILQWPNHTQTIFYMVKSNGKKDDEWEYESFIAMFTKAKINDSFGLDVLVFLSKESRQHMEYIWKGFVDQGRDASWWVAYLMLFKTFLKYADVESKVLAGNKKEHHIGVKYMNDTKRRIEILDSTYYTTISRTEGFGVRGHFRFQPYGQGMSKKRLQWISAFEKHGYTRQAKIAQTNIN